MVALPKLRDKNIKLSGVDGYYKDDEKPELFGHYWLNCNPFQIGSNIECLDFIVARNGYLTAYRMNGE
ncbi:hypothetical protein GM418_00435 [Maribellus comscasis]|uniref:Uncharacterized protein n=1 Tax=Maribellus comscasis TaxID=2681766 RepID=A0A6I6JQ88_9BACT|nr:hypothetical protein [Maribellus comscasis]QGY42173.1 hypothetical protein GM418_00435 [Maribellus comscasis]